MHTHYTPEFLEAQKSALLGKKQELESELEKISRFDESSGTYVALQPEFNSDSPEEFDEAGGESETGQTNTAITSELATTLAETELALSKMEQGTYGKCEKTGEWIEEARLRAYPAARTHEGMETD